MGRITFVDYPHIFMDIKVPEVGEDEEDYTCQYCDDEITLEQIKKSIGGKVSNRRVNNINKALPFINKYRKDFNLDTCLKKAHFIAQVIHESARFYTFEEYEDRNYKNKKGKVNSIPGIFSNKKIEFDETIGESLKNHLTEIFKIVDCNDVVLTKTSDQIKKILIDEKVKVVDKKLYTNYDSGDELLKTVMEILTDSDGNEVEEIKYKIYLQNHKYFGVPLLSRMYAPYPGDKRGLGNGGELTKDGWKFKGRGLKQLTGKSNYEEFKKYRDKNTFTDDTSGEIDFTLEHSSGDIHEGNYVKISEDAMYAVQSALYFWNEGTKYQNKYAFEHAENDDVTAVSKAINYYDDNGLPHRKKYYQKARKKDAFDIVRHYKDIYDNGTSEQKEDAKAYFEKWKNDDEEAEKILNELNESQSTEENNSDNSEQNSKN